SDLSRVDYRLLNADARNQYDTAKSFIRRSDEAVRAKNLVFAKNLADKAAAPAAQLAGKEEAGYPTLKKATHAQVAARRARPKAADFLSTSQGRRGTRLAQAGGALFLLAACGKKHDLPIKTCLCTTGGPHGLPPAN